MRYAIAILAISLLAACGGPAAPSAATVGQALTAAGAQNLHEEALGAGVPVPHSFTSHQVFALASVAPSGGQVFICDTKKNCDAIYAYFTALKALAGPYTYQSDSGLVVVQLNKGLSPAEAAAIEQVVKSL